MIELFTVVAILFLINVINEYNVLKKAYELEQLHRQFEQAYGPEPQEKQ